MVDRICLHVSHQLNQLLLFFHKMSISGRFACPKITLYGISGHFRSIGNFYLFRFFTQWPTLAIFDARKSFLIKLLAISNKYVTLFFSILIAFIVIFNQQTIFFNFPKMSADDHFGCLKITIILSHFSQFQIK